MRSSSAAPLSNSWLPTAEISSPIRLRLSMVGSSRNSALTSGDAPIKSPAATNTLLAWPLRNSATALDRNSEPPASTFTVLPGLAGSAMRMPPRAGRRLPWKSLMASTRTFTGSVATGVDGVAQPASKVTKNAAATAAESGEKAMRMVGSLGRRCVGAGPVLLAEVGSVAGGAAVAPGAGQHRFNVVQQAAGADAETRRVDGISTQVLRCQVHVQRGVGHGADAA